jgi:hypothetical protein
MILFKMSDTENVPLKLNKLWTKNTHHKLYNLYIDIIICLKYSATEEEAYIEIEDLNLKDPIRWADWANGQFNNKDIPDIYRNYEKIEDTDCKLCSYEHKYCGKCEY